MDELDKYYRAYVTIDLDAIYNNIVQLRANLNENTDILAVIKTDGYGHGAIPIAHIVKDLVRGFAVATIDEAINLRENNIKNLILVIGFVHESQFQRAIMNEIRLTVYSYEAAKLLSEEAVRLNKNAYIHIKLDTGMSRIGFLAQEESINEIVKISQLKNIVIEGIFTHFATADELDKSKAYAQFNRFCEFIKQLEEKNIYIPMKHCSNSAAMIEMNNANMDCVRAGIAMYGLYPSEEVDHNKVTLTPALSLYSHIIHLKELEKGTPISYGGTFVTKKKTRVATIPIGYGDGYRRSLSNRGYVLINGKRANILGRICMDQFMVDVTDIEDVKVGNLVVLIGKSENEYLSVEKLASLATETFNYEIVCDLGKRIPRVFYRNGKIVCMKDYFSDKYDVKIN